MLHRNGWRLFKHTIAIYLYLQIQILSLICWTKSTPQDVPSLHQTFRFAEKLMTHLRFSPFETNQNHWFCFLHEQTKMKFSLSSARGLQEHCWGTAAEPEKREVESTRGFGKASTKPVKPTLGLGKGNTDLVCECSEWGNYMWCVCRGWEPQSSIISACLMPSAHLPFCHNSVVL